MDLINDHFGETASPDNDTQCLSERPTGLKSFGNQCYINTVFQCLASLRSMKELDKHGIPYADEKAQFLRYFRHELNEFQFNKREQIDRQSLQVFVKRLQSTAWNAQHDASEVLDYLFTDLERYIPQVYLNFVVTSSFACEKNLDQLYPSWCLTINVSHKCNYINLSDGLASAVHVQNARQVCKCGSKTKIHFYGEMPMCLAVKFYKYSKDFMVRKDVQLMLQPNQTIAGVRYELKSAVRYVGDDKEAPPNLANPKQSKPSMWDKMKIIWDESHVDQKTRKVFPTGKSSKLRNFSTSIAKYCMANKSAQAQVPQPKPDQKIAEFVSTPRKGRLPTDGTSGHYTAFVRRKDDFYFVNDDKVMKLDTVHTDDLFVLFYERVL